MHSSYKLTVIVPFYNEQKFLKASVGRLLKIKTHCEIILVDDASTDNSNFIAEQLVLNNKNVQLFTLNQNYGKGEAIKHALNYVTTKYVVVHDADMEYNPIDLDTMFNTILNSPNSLILGSRTIGNIDRVKLYKIPYFGNKILTILFSILNNYKLSDIASCYWMLQTEDLKKLNIQEKGFCIEVEVLSKFLSINKEIIEIPINYQGRTYEDGKKIKFKDGVLIFIKILKYSKLKKFFLRN